MSCVFLRRNWNEPGGTQPVDVEKKKKKKRDSVVNGNIPTFIVRCYREGSRANPLEYYFIFLSVGGEM